MNNNGQRMAFPDPSRTAADPGLTKREYMATQIAASIAGAGDVWPRDDDGEIIAIKAVLIADALLAKLSVG